MSNFSDRTYVYALDKDYFTVAYEYIPQYELSVRVLMAKALCLADKPGVKFVFAVDNSWNVFTSFRDAQSTRSMEDRVVFKLMLETEGLRLL